MPCLVFKRVVDKLHVNAGCLSIHAHSTGEFVQDMVDNLYAVVLACSFSFIITLSRHLMLVHRTGGLVQDMVGVAVYLQAVLLHRWTCIYDKADLLYAGADHLVTTLSRLSMRVYHVGGPAQDVVDVFYTGAGHFSTTLRRHSMLVHYISGLVQDMGDIAVYSQACLLHRWTCKRCGWRVPHWY